MISKRLKERIDSRLKHLDIDHRVMIINAYQEKFGEDDTNIDKKLKTLCKQLGVKYKKPFSLFSVFIKFMTITTLLLLVNGWDLLL